MGYKKGKPNEWKTDNFKYAFMFTVATLLVYLIAFASPYWLQLYATVPYDFKNMGLWEICLDNYVFREDGFIRVFDGCYWSFAIELEDRRRIFNPAYFVVCQVFSVGVLLSVGVCCMIMSMIFLRATGQQKWTYWILSTILCLLMTISSALIFVILVIVGVKSGDRVWMPRADLIWLSWGYAAACLANLFAAIAAFFYGKDAKAFWGAQAPINEMFGFPMSRQGDAGLEPPPESGSVFAY